MRCGASPTRAPEIFFKLNVDICALWYITAMHGMQTRYSDEKTVCPSVCLSVCSSVKRVNCDKKEERSVQILYHTKEHLA